MRRRVLFSILLSLSIIILGWGVISYLSLKESIDNSIKKRLDLANFISAYLDGVIDENIKNLYDISTTYKIDFEDKDWDPEISALDNLYRYSIFSEGVFFLDIYGNLVLSYPSTTKIGLNFMDIPFINNVISENRPFVSSVYTLRPENVKIVYIVVPLRNTDGRTIGVVGGMVDLTGRGLSRLLEGIKTAPDVYIELVDGNGIIIASNKQSRVLTTSDHNRFLSNLILEHESTVGMCHRCHFEGKEKTNDVMVFVPLRKAPWGVLIREPEDIVFAPATTLKRSFMLFGLITIAASVFLTIGITRSVVKPIEQLIHVTKRIESGDISTKIEYSGTDEIGELARSFEKMRKRLAESIEFIKRQNIELERKVKERTSQLEESRRKISFLLKEVISGQEEERKRIARDLHDETMQELSAFLMKLEFCKLYPESLTEEKIDEMCAIVQRILNSIRNAVQHLRPSVLDDLGLDAAINWLLERTLREKGINYFLTIKGEKGRRYNPELEIALFRIVQEAVTNIAKHSEAENVYVVIKNAEDYIEINVEDDGKGFNVKEIMEKTSVDGGALGILGMKERATLFDGRFRICSSEGMGTRVSVWFPVRKEADIIVKD